MTETPEKIVNIPVQVGLWRVLLGGVYKSKTKMTETFSKICPSFSKRRAARYGDQPKERQIGAILTEEERCTDCPLNYAKFERDAISYVVFDRVFRNLLVLLTEAGKCGLWKDSKSSKHKRSIYLRSEIITFQLGLDSVVIHSSSPGDLSEIGEWIRNNLSGYYSDIESLVYRVINPCLISKNERTIDIIDPRRIKILQTLLKKSDFSLIDEYFSSENEVIPHLKIYNKDRINNKKLRIEFVCYKNFQTSSLIVVRDELLRILDNLTDNDQAFLDYIEKYYPKTIELKFLNLITQLKEEVTIIKGTLNNNSKNLENTIDGFFELMKKEFSELKVSSRKNVQVINPGIEDKIDAVADKIDERSSVEDISEIISEVFNISQNASKVFLAYIQREDLNKIKSIKRQIKIGSITDIFRDGKVKDPILSQRKTVIACTEELIKTGLFLDKSGNQLETSAAGKILTKKILLKKGKTIDARGDLK